MLNGSTHQPSVATAAGGSVATSPTPVSVTAAGAASPRSPSHRQPDARVVDDNEPTRPHPARPYQQPTPGCQCTGGASTDCPPASGRRPGCPADGGGPTAPAGATALPPAGSAGITGGRPDPARRDTGRSPAPRGTTPYQADGSPAGATGPTEKAAVPVTPTPTPYSDPDAVPELVALALQGNQRAWQDLVTRYSPLVSSVIRRYRMNDSDADDVRQNLWLRLVEHLGNIREPRALPGWVMTTTRNEAIRVLAGKRRTEPVNPQQDDRLDNIEHTEPDSDLIRAEYRAAVHAGLRELRPEHRELIELIFADTPISYQQISARLGIPIGSIGPTRARCLKKLERTAAIRALAS